MTEEKREEELRSKSSTKDIYYFVDTEKEIDQKSKEVFKKKDEMIHYPIGFDGGDRYKNLKKFIFRDINKKTPRGINKSANVGYGFTRLMRAFGEYLDEVLKLKVVVFSKDITSKLDLSRKSIQLDINDFDRIYEAMKQLSDRHKNERVHQVNRSIHNLFPNKVEAIEGKYIKNTISTVLSNWNQSISEFSLNDKESIKELFDMMALMDDFFDSKSLIKTKEKVDYKYIEDVLSQYKDLLGQKTETANLESRWQALLRDHSWIFSYIFSCN